MHTKWFDLADRSVLLLARCCPTDAERDELSTRRHHDQIQIWHIFWLLERPRSPGNGHIGRPKHGSVQVDIRCYFIFAAKRPDRKPGWHWRMGRRGLVSTCQVQA